MDKKIKNYRKNAFKVLLDYTAALVIFIIILYAVFSISKEKFMTYLPYYSFIMFLLTFAILYSDMKGIGEKEKRPNYDLNPYPLKGLIYGVLGFLPYILLEAASAVVVLQDQLAARIEHLTINTLLGPMYFIIGFFGERPVGYIAASAVIPLVAMLGYMSGYFGLLGKKDVHINDTAKNEQTFTKSPWHPTNRPVQTVVPKKKKK